MNDTSPLPNIGMRFAEALARFDAENSRDPHSVLVHGEPRPRELAYAEWLTDWVLQLSPRASEPLLLAARSQHIGRWKIPRTSYPATRAGYLQWRAELKRFHAETSGRILEQVGYPPETIARVRELNLKQNLATDPECQVLEDALCLVTLRYQFAEVLEKTGPEKLIAIIQKTLRKMSPQAQNVALTLPFPSEHKELIEKALQG
jgi:hypothetical protein